MSYVFMKVLESAPERYDQGMQLLTLGRLERVHASVASRLKPGDQVLDVGCGTGALAVRMAARGCQVTGIDIAAPMLKQARQRVQEARLEDCVCLREISALDLDTMFLAESFDVITSILFFSELFSEEIAYVLAECRRLLRPGGRLLVADEVQPDSVFGRLTTFLLRMPFVVAAFVLTQNSTRRVARLPERIRAAGFDMLESEHYLAGTLRLYVAAGGE